MATVPAMLVILLLLFFSQISSAIDTITQLQPLADGSSLVSNDGSFELGFFSPGNSTNRYVGIWHRSILPRRVLWVANRDHRINDNSGVLSISREGNLVLLSQNHTLVWSTNHTSKALSPIAQLLNTGNLVLTEQNNDEVLLWQSFDYPTDTLLQGMKLGWDLRTGVNRRLIAWKNWDDPSPGDLTCGIELSSNPQLVIWKGSAVFHETGPWNGIGFSGTYPLWANPVFDYQFINNSDEVYYTYSLRNKSLISVVVMNQTLLVRQRITWVPKTGTWQIYRSVPQDNCDVYNHCGPNGNCMVHESPVCHCLEGFQPNSSQSWGAVDWMQGCVRREPWSCKVKNKDGFRKFTNMKLPDTRYSWVNSTMTLEDCNTKCFEDCSCTAYAKLDIRGAGSGCVIWFGDLNDLRLFPENGQDLYIRMATSVTDAKLRHKKKVALLIIIPLMLVLVMVLALSYIYKTKRKDREKRDKGGQEDLELPFFDLVTIVNATNNFSVDNKLGEGGFGPVYKGILADGQKIAVKRLSRSSGQGLKEFKNEVILCAKLQHRNLVKVLGCCIQREEKMLVYEYMANKSLDSFLFDPAHNKLLDWPKRFNILCSIARGLLYLHHDSRLRIIHRDLKASNILLDDNMNPKISDFGLATMCRGDQVEGNTSKVVGTHGYMAPEYAIDGLFSPKSDVFSFGILLLEIVSGKKNRGISYPGDSQNLIEHAWRLWKESNQMKLIDDCLKDSCNPFEAFRCIHIGLLCVQHNPNDRPDMSSVIVMLNSENTLPQPKEPGFLIDKLLFEGECSSRKRQYTINNVTISVLDPR